MTDQQQRQSKWRVVGLDAADQNAITNGPNPNGPNFGDVADNSFEQQVAMKTWIDAAVDMLNRGEAEDAIVAKLAHDGCPDPQQVLQQALSQPPKDPLTDEAGNTPPTGLPPQDDANAVEAMPPGTVQASVEEVNAAIALDPVRRLGHVTSQESDIDSLNQRVASAEGEDAAEAREALAVAWQNQTDRLVSFTGRTARILGAYVDTFDRVILRVAGDDGQQDIPAEAAELVPETKTDYVSEVQKFIDSFPEVEPNELPIVQARVANLAQAKEMIDECLAVPALAHEQQTALSSLRLQVDGAISASNGHVASLLNPDEVEYLASRPKYEIASVVSSQAGHSGGGDIPLDDIARTIEGAALSHDWQSEVDEGSSILVSEIDPEVLEDEYAVAGQAAREINSKTGGLDEKTRGEIRDVYLATVERRRQQRIARLHQERQENLDRISAEATQHTAATETHVSDDGPADALFI